MPRGIKLTPEEKSILELRRAAIKKLDALSAQSYTLIMSLRQLDKIDTTVRILEGKI